MRKNNYVTEINSSLAGCLRNSFFIVLPVSIGGNVLHNNTTSHGQSTGESSLPLVAKIVGSSLLALLCLSGVLWFAFRHRRKSL